METVIKKITLRQHKAIDRLLRKLPDEFRRCYFRYYLQRILQLTTKQASIVISVLIGTIRYERYLRKKSRGRKVNKRELTE